MSDDTPLLPVRRLTLYKHGVAHLEREGRVDGEHLRLAFPHHAMDDVLKSLVVLDRAGGRVLGVDVETAEDRAAVLARARLHLGDQRSLLDLLRDLRGRAVRVHLHDGDAVEATVVGVDVDDERPVKRAVLTVLERARPRVRSWPVADVAGLDLLDEAADDLGHVLRVSRADVERRRADVRLDPGDHDLLVAYLVPAPAWRVSYRMVADTATGEALLLGWGVIDNAFDEELVDVAVELVAGQPVSFRYRLYEGHVPERPELGDEVRPVPLDLPAAPRPIARLAMAAPAREAFTFDAAGAMPAAALAADDLEQSVAGVAEGEGQGALFAYRVPVPVSVGRNQTALVPIVDVGVPGRRELHHRGGAGRTHPMASLRVTNTSGLTLERGPVTVFEDGRYGGEAVLPFTRPGVELDVHYAVELGVRVDERVEQVEQVVAVAVEGAWARIEAYDDTHTTYRLTSDLTDDAVVVVDHARRAGTELVGGPPTPERDGRVRWEVPVPAGGEVTATMVERRRVWQRERVEGLNPLRVAAWREAGLLSSEAREVLDRVVALQHQLAEVTEHQQRLAEERAQLLERQQHLGAALAPLGPTGREGQLRTRYVDDLGRLQDRLDVVDGDERDARARADELRADLLAVLAE